MSNYDPYKSTWLNPDIEYLFDTDIIEYDMKDAGFSLIKQYNLISNEKIKELKLMGKGIERHIAIGKMQREDKELSKQLMEKFAILRMAFISANKINDNDIISVKKDAIFTISPVKKLKFGNIIFDKKHEYSSYIRFPNIQNLEIYYNNNDIDIKGMSDQAVNRHRLYLIEFLRKYISLIESKDPKIKRWIIKFIDDYKWGKLEEDYYLEFNNKSRDYDPVFNYKNLIIPLIQIIQQEID